MKLRITRLVILSQQNDLRAFQPGLVVDVDDATAEAILQRQAGIPIEPATPAEPDTEPVQPAAPTAAPPMAEAAPPRTPAAPRRRKSAHAPT